METRSHRDRLRANLAEVREELRKEVSKFTDAELDWSPASEHEMKSVRGILAEIGAMEGQVSSILLHDKEDDWMAVVEQFNQAKSIGEAIELLDAKRAETIQYLDTDPHADLQTRVRLPDSWEQYFGTLWVEAEELISWILRHEYYHLGQLIIYLWQTGRNPYK
jgi:uncharacterized damage-inducible protein DinB